MKKWLVVLLMPVVALAQPGEAYNLVNGELATRWDEAMPLGNGMLGALIWQKDNKLRLSLDRADVWDERSALDLSTFNFSFVHQQVLKKDYDTVHKLGDWPYDNIAYPTKLPAGAIEFDLEKLGAVKQVSLDIAKAVCVVAFTNGTTFSSYIHATDNTGYFIVENPPPGELAPKLITPDYSGANSGTAAKDQSGQGLGVLGYQQGTVMRSPGNIRYHQPTYDGHFYEVLVQWKNEPGNAIIGRWTISNDKTATMPAWNTLNRKNDQWNMHQQWWKEFWSKSSVTLPVQQLQRQYYLELYKLGCVSRKGAPAITLQAVWTADNGSLPPWKGDFHHDLNTQLSYWPCYTGNHLQEAVSYTDWLWNVRKENKRYTSQFFGVDGLAVPGVTTLNGKAMGGWIQYSLSPSVSSWLAQHFYWQWKYSMDKTFLSSRAYPYLHDVATFVENISYLKEGKRQVALSSSPEYHNNDIKAWFTQLTNYDLSLYRFVLQAAVEAAAAMDKPDEAQHWRNLLQEFPSFDVNATGLTIAPGQNLEESHRHHAQLMPIYPIAQLDVNKADEKTIIDASLAHLAKIGTREWCGYSFSWLACVYARAKQADSAVKQLTIFASNFCSPNSFHLNGDQKGGEYSNFTYRPFTLEGNFAFAQGVHELLLQSKGGYIEVFPAVPRSWNNVSFTNLRTEGAFLVSAKKENGVPTEVTITAEHGGTLTIRLPFRTWLTRNYPAENVQLVAPGMITLPLQKGQTITIENGYE